MPVRRQFLRFLTIAAASMGLVFGSTAPALAGAPGESTVRPEDLSWTNCRGKSLPVTYPDRAQENVVFSFCNQTSEDRKIVTVFQNGLAIVQLVPYNQFKYNITVKLEYQLVAESGAVKSSYTISLPGPRANYNGAVDLPSPQHGDVVKYRLTITLTSLATHEPTTIVSTTEPVQVPVGA